MVRGRVPAQAGGRAVFARVFTRAACGISDGRGCRRRPGLPCARAGARRAGRCDGSPPSPSLTGVHAAPLAAGPLARVPRVEVVQTGAGTMLQSHDTVELCWDLGLKTVIAVCGDARGTFQEELCQNWGRAVHG